MIRKGTKKGTKEAAQSPQQYSQYNPTKQPIISPELIKLNTQYTFTICPEDKHQYWGNDTRDKQSYREYNTMIYQRCVSSNIHVILYQELSRTGRIHYHGTIEFKNHESIHRFYMNSLYHMRQGNIIEIDTIEDPAHWQTYITKYQHLHECIIDNSKPVKTASAFEVIS